MPELPEVENARRCLVQAELPGRTFTGANIGWAKTVKKPGLEEFVLGLQGSRVQAANRRGKYILLPLDSGDGPTPRTLILHLGMSGGLFVQPQSQAEPPMVRHTFPLDDDRELRFVDGRKFGKLWLVDDPREVLPPLSPDPLEEGFTLELLAQTLSGRNAPIKALLLEQSIAAGVGNLYADESLFLAGIHPLRSGSELSGEEIARLRQSIVEALTAGVAIYDKSRLDNWPDPPRALHAWTIPRTADEPCPRCGGPISSTRVRARGTYFCTGCQE